MDINDLRAIVTLISMIMFALICWWAYSKRNQEAFDEIAQVPLHEDEESGLLRKEASS